MKILLLEDDQNLHQSLKDYLEIDGFDVVSAFNSKDVYHATYKEKFDLYIFDVNVPGDNGFEVLESLKNANDKTPAIYITALTDIKSLATAFEVGADDFIKKPFDPEELVLRIKNKYQKNKIINYKNIKYNSNTKEIYIDDKNIFLGIVLKSIFHELIINKNKMILSDNLYEYLEEPNPNALRANVSKLKSKLNLDIKNIRGLGYILEEL
ncbi:DNA-binding response regulator CiaR [hydrothermal vent metagenome]|uniref:DNA-binding response regulator CiaR n=1 Tax=hydrothermal vent metagenome TaxID=652676 RepID=A0A3B1E6S2_9ZZZZ